MGVGVGSTTDSVDEVQSFFTDQTGLAYAGNVANYRDRVTNNAISQFWTPNTLICGRGVVQGNPQNWTNGTPSVRQPFAARIPTTADRATINTIFLGAVYRPQTNVFSVDDGTDDDGNTVYSPGFRARRVIPVVQTGYKQHVFVKQTADMGTITAGDPVYIVLSDAARFGNNGDEDWDVKPGDFVNTFSTNGSSGTPVDDGTNTALLSNATWFWTREAGSEVPPSAPTGTVFRDVDPLNIIVFG